MLVSRLSSFLLLLLLAPLGLAVAAGDGKPKSEVEFGTRRLDLPFGETTEVYGKIPIDLRGVWLVSENHAMSGGKTYPTVQLYRIDLDQEKHLRINLLTWQPPQPVQEKLMQAQTAQQSWSPSQEDLAAIKLEVAKSVPPADPKRRGKHIVTASADYKPEMKATKQSAGSTFAIQSLFQPSDRPPYGESYYMKTASAEEMNGALTLGAVPQGAKGVPLPVGTTGTVRWIRVDGAGAPPTPK